MLVIISDLHLTDGSSGEVISDSAFRLFKNGVSDMAYDASWRCDGKDCAECRDNSDCQKYYRPVENVDIILLGDIFDMIRSEQWNNELETIMPWSQPWQDEFFAVVEKIISGILLFNHSSLNILKGITTDGDLKIPASMQLAGPEERTARKIKYKANGSVSVKVNMYYMVGNHDWFFYINDSRMANIRNQVIDALGLANEKDKPFPYHRNECKAIENIQETHEVFAEHGDMYDKTNFKTPHRDASSVGDVVVIKLLNTIPARIERYIQNSKEKAGDKKDIEIFIKQLREIDNLRPYMLAPAWIAQVMTETKLDKKIVNEAIRKTLRSVLSDFTKNTLIEKKRLLKIQLLLVKLLLGYLLNIKALSILIDHTSYSKVTLESYRQHAINMANGQEKNFFVMGHTHYAEIVPLSTYVDKEGISRNKIYINTGTWRSVHLRSITDKGFISYKMMAIAGFYKKDERKGRPFEFWTGALAL